MRVWRHRERCETIEENERSPTISQIVVPLLAMTPAIHIAPNPA
jgi:hypothetical protein